MSRFFSEKYASLTPYVPGEQPQDKQYIKLNTNENPFPPSEKTLRYAAEHAKSFELYSDPDCTELRKTFAEVYDVDPDEVVAVNGSDEILNFAFMAFCDAKHPAVFPDITYGFYPVLAALNNVPYEEIPLKDDFSIDVNDYIGVGKTIFLANPNAPTGKLMPVADVETIIASNPDSVVLVDEAYVDFGGESCIPLIRKYDNLLVTRTFSKSHSLAGARLGFGIGNQELIADINTIRYSTNPYNINSETMALGIGALLDGGYTKACSETIQETRAYTVDGLKALGFELTDSCANFLFARTPRMSGEELYRKLRENGILVRHFPKPRIADYNRISIGTRAQMQTLLETTKRILEETK